MLSTPNQPILLVEDSPEDYEMALRGLKKAGLRNPIQHCWDGDEALDYLYHRGAFAEHFSPVAPGIILLDLNMPRMDGREFLEELKRDPVLKQIPVVVLTTFADEWDIQDCYRRGANSYMQKPLDFEGFMNAMSRLSNYCFEVVVLPHPVEDV